jgi:hypothetical protein
VRTITSRWCSSRQAAPESRNEFDIDEGHPHGHWMGHDGKTMVTRRNAFTRDSTIFELQHQRRAGLVSVGEAPSPPA